MIVRAESFQFSSKPAEGTGVWLGYSNQRESPRTGARWRSENRFQQPEELGVI